MRRTGRRGVVGVVGVLGLALFGMLGGAVAHQDDPGITGLVHACVATRNGAVRIVGPTGACDANKETAAHWLGGRFIDLGLTVYDTQTKLQWEKKNGADGVQDLANRHDVDNTYTWCAATGNATGFCGGNTTSWIAEVNAENFAGYSDWRVPTGGLDGGELATILAPCPAGGGPCIDPVLGPTLAFFYWSATEAGVGVAWFVNFSSGNVSTAGTNLPFHVRAVRGGP